MVVEIVPAHVGSSPHERGRKDCVSEKRVWKGMAFMFAFASQFVLDCSLLFVGSVRGRRSCICISVCSFVDGPSFAHPSIRRGGPA